MKVSAWVVLIYGVLVLGGGLIGYAKAHSTASLLMGGISALILLVCAFGIFKNSRASLQIATAAIALLTVFFSYRFFSSFKFFPSGIMTIISLGVLLLVLLRWNKNP